MRSRIGQPKKRQKEIILFVQQMCMRDCHAFCDNNLQHVPYGRRNNSNNRPGGDCIVK